MSGTPSGGHDIESLVALADLRLRQGRVEEAWSSLKRAVSQRPRDPVLQVMLATTARMRGDLAAAERHAARAATLAPRDHRPAMLLGTLHLEAGRIAEAVAAFDAAIQIQPDDSDAHSNRAIALRRSHRTVDALAALERAALLADLSTPGRAYESWIELAHVRQEEGDATGAVQAFEAAAARRPGDAHALLGRAVSLIPVVAEHEEEIAQSRASYAEALRDLDRRLGSDISAVDLANATGSIQPFHLAYTGENDVALQSLFGAIIARGAPAIVRRMQSPRDRSNRFRLAIVSGFFRDHPVWNVLLNGWTRWCRDTGIEAIGFHTGLASDARTADAVGQLCRLETGPRPKSDWAALIRDAAPDAILYPEVGMDPVVPYLAAQRLAPLQLAAWGHPTTTGLPTIDRFLGSDAMEPADADGHYSEALVRLPGLGFLPIVPASPARAERQGTLNETLFWCGQHLAKYRPRHDDVFPRIAQALPDARFLFVSRPVGAIAEAVFRRRLGRAFAAHGLSADDHCRFLPYRPVELYRAALAGSDIFLDTVGWSGLATTLDAIGCGVPIVTLESGLMRGRQSAALLRRMGLDERVAATEDVFVTRAVALGSSREERIRYAGLIASSRSLLTEQTQAPLVAFRAAFSI